MESLFQDFRFALRALRKSPGFALVCVLTLALGIGANTAIFSAAEAVFLRPLPYPDPGRLVWLAGMFPGSTSGDDNFSFRDFLDLRAGAPAFEAAAAYHDFSAVSLTGVTEPIRLTTNFVSEGYFEILGVRPAVGRTFTADESQPGSARPVAVLSDGVWRRAFGADPSIVGRAIQLNQMPVTVIGVMSPRFRDLDDPTRPAIDLWLPVGMAPSLTGQVQLDDRGGQLFWGIGRLKRGATLAAAREQARAVAERLGREFPASNKGFGLAVYPLRDHLVGDLYGSVSILLAGSLFVLLIGCANVANLILGRLVRRRHELAVRAAIGGTRTRLLRQLLAESVLVAIAAGATGIVMGSILLRLLSSGIFASLPSFAPLEMNSRILGLSLALSLATVVLFGLAPAWQGTKMDLREALHESGGRVGGGRRGAGRRALIIAETGIALVLLVGAGLTLKSVERLTATGLDFPTENLLTMRVDLRFAKYADAEARGAFARTLVERAEAIPGVSSAILWGPSNIGHSTWVSYIAPQETAVRDQSDLLMVHRHSTNPGGLGKLGIPLLRGREFTWDDDAHAPRVAVVSRSLAEKFWPNANPVGRRLQVQGLAGALDAVTVVGVASDARLRRRFDVHSGVEAFKPQLDLYVPYPQRANRGIAFAVRTANPAATAPLLRHALKSLDPDLPVYDIRTLRDRLADEEAVSRGMASLMALYAGVALFLAALGIFSVLAHDVSQRTHEIGVRLALGARGRDVVKMIVGQGMAWTAAGVGAGLAGAFALTRVMRGFLFDVSPTDAGTFGAVAALFLLVALLACALPARRAARVEPLVAMRND